MNTLPNMPQKVKVIEVVSRDGFQAESAFIPTAEKVKVIDTLSKSGLKNIEVTSFVSPKAVPQLKDAKEVMDNIERVDGVTYSALVPNRKGAERALQCRLDEWGLMLSLSESHSKANINRSQQETIREIEDIVKVAKENGIQLNGGLITALGCPFEGEVPLELVNETVEMYQSMGVNIINVADTAGMSAPSKVYTVMKTLRDRFPDLELVAHFHDTRNMAMANVIAAMAAGVTAFDTACGGLGGCPFIPGACGNLATEDLVHMLDLMHIETGVDIDCILDTGRNLEQLLGKKLPGKVLQAGKSGDLKPV